MVTKVPMTWLHLRITQQTHIYTPAAMGGPKLQHIVLFFLSLFFSHKHQIPSKTKLQRCIHRTEKLAICNNLPLSPQQTGSTERQQ